MTSETWVLSKIETRNKNSVLSLEEKYIYTARGILLSLIALVFERRLKHLDPKYYAKFSHAIGADLAVVEDIVESIGLGLINECITERRKFIQNQRIKASKGGRAYMNNNNTAGKQRPEDGIIICPDGTWEFDQTSERFKTEIKEFIDKHGDLAEVLRRLYAHFKSGKGDPYAYLKAILRKETESIGKYGRPNTDLSKDPNVIILKDYFYASFKNKFHKDYIADVDKDSKVFGNLLKVMSVDDLNVDINTFFASKDEFIMEKGGFTIGVFKSQINKLRSICEKEKPLDASDRIARKHMAEVKKRCKSRLETQECETREELEEERKLKSEEGIKGD